MSPGPSRHFGGPSRAVNSLPYKKKAKKSLCISRKAKGKTSLDLIAKHEPGEHAFDDRATHFWNVPTPALTLPSFKVEPSRDAFFRAESVFNEIRPHSSPDEDDLQDEEGMPTRSQWRDIVGSYLMGLHPSKRDKALITRCMHEMIFHTLVDPDATRLGTPQFRFWARKMFQLVEAGGALVITNGGRPVAVKEYIYDILCMCHAESGHAGRDKTCKVLREYYTWIPKDLTANFVKACPTCRQKRTGEAAFVTEKKHLAPSDTSSRQPYLLEGDRSAAGSSQYSVKHVEDFGRNSGSFYGQQPLFLVKSTQQDTSFNFSHPARRNDFHSEDGYSLESSLNSSLSHARPPLADDSLPILPHANKSEFTLPPLNNNPDNNDVKVEHRSEGMRLSLPPLMQFLSQSDIDTEMQIRREHNSQRSCAPSPAVDIPIDPALLCANESRGFRLRKVSPESTSSISACSPNICDGSMSAFEPQPQPPAEYQSPRYSVATVDIPLAQIPYPSFGVWEYRGTVSSSRYGVNDALSLTPTTGEHVPSKVHQLPKACASDEHIRCTLLQQGNDSCDLGVSVDALPLPLYSPVPIKLEEASAMLELATRVR